MYLYKNKLVILIFLSFCFHSICNAELIKPKNSIKPLEVVEIQLNGLKNNNEPYEDFGIEQTWEFAHPNNKKYTGPLEKFKSMLKSDMYEMLINHIENKIDIISASENSATYRVTVLDDKKKYYQFEWVVKKYGGEIEEIPFPDHLKGKYQEYTCAKKEWGEYNFKTIPQYLEELP